MCRNATVGYWSKENVDMRATRVREKGRVACYYIKSHPLTPGLSADLFVQEGIGVFRFSATLIEWSQSEWEGLQKSGYKRVKSMARTMVNRKLSLHLPNCKGWP